MKFIFFLCNFLIYVCPSDSTTVAGSGTIVTSQPIRGRPFDSEGGGGGAGTFWK